MKELKQKCFWSGMTAKVFLLLGCVNSFITGYCIHRGKFLFVIIPVAAVICCTYTSIQVNRYYLFLKAAKQRPQYSYSFNLHEVSRIKLSFSTFLSMYLANTKPWSFTNNQVAYYSARNEQGRYVIHYIESVTIVYFDFPDYVKYRSWVKEHNRLQKEAAEKKAEAEAAETELKLNLQFLDTVTEDVKKMKASAEAEIQKAADELKKINSTGNGGTDL